MKDLTYKCHTLAINELPNFKNLEDKLYRGTTIIDGKKWEKDGSVVYLIESWFQSKIDSLYRGKTYEEVSKIWGGRTKKITYKNHVMYITVLPHPKSKNPRAFYIGTYYPYRINGKFSSTFESIHYYKIISKFERFVDEYFTDWQPCDIQQLNGGDKLYTLTIKLDLSKKLFFGSCEIHKNSTFKCISKSFREIEEKFKARIDQILYHKQGIKVVDSKEERLKQLEVQIAKLQQELDKVKNEKEIYIYKGVTLEYGKEEGLEEGYMVGRIKNAPKDTRDFYRKVASNMQVDFEEYIDELEGATKIYLQITGKQIAEGENESY